MNRLYTMVFAGALLLAGCGGGGSSPDATASSGGGGSSTDALGSALEQVLTRGTGSWLQVDYAIPFPGSRVDANYTFKVQNGERIGTRQRINIRGNNVSPFNELLTQFKWALTGNILTLEINNIVGTPVSTETMTLNYDSAADLIEVQHEVVGVGLWRGCQSTARPPYPLSLLAC